MNLTVGDFFGMLLEILKLFLLSIACGAVSMTISKAKIFLPLRDWISQRNAWAGEGISCPYCTSHWVAFILMMFYFPHPLHCGFIIVDFLVSLMVVVALASLTARLILYSYSD